MYPYSIVLGGAVVVKVASFKDCAVDPSKPCVAKTNKTNQIPKAFTLPCKFIHHFLGKAKFAWQWLNLVNQWADAKTTAKDLRVWLKAASSIGKDATTPHPMAYIATTNTLPPTVMATYAQVATPYFYHMDTAGKATAVPTSGETWKTQWKAKLNTPPTPPVADYDTESDSE